MDGGSEGSQQPHLNLANKLFLLTHRDVQDIEKVRLKSEVLDSIKSDGMAPLYKTLAASLVVDLDQSLLDSMKANNEEDLKKLKEKITDTEENLGESEVREAYLAKAQYFIRSVIRLLASCNWKSDSNQIDFWDQCIVWPYS